MHIRRSPLKRRGEGVRTDARRLTKYKGRPAEVLNMYNFGEAHSILSGASTREEQCQKRLQARREIQEAPHQGNCKSK